ncbi:nuclear transport factor 2 family protein [Plantactinospora sp. GCM10030261]|uniref:nuclear transport factor 2 family protein n=1 Tax=Plantactinospora sp. GCM10030261 TaxID=3273420 RepID=UPI0036061CCE
MTGATGPGGRHDTTGGKQMTDGDPAGTPPEDVRAELEGLYRDWFAALPGNDAAFFERTLADDWHYTNVTGEVRGKREYLEYIAPLPADTPPNRLLELTVRRFDPVVIVHGRYAVPELLAPPGMPETRFTAVWIRRDGRWSALTHHATGVPVTG